MASCSSRRILSAPLRRLFSSSPGCMAAPRTVSRTYFSSTHPVISPLHSPHSAATTKLRSSFFFPRLPPSPLPQRAPRLRHPAATPTRRCVSSGSSGSGSGSGAGPSGSTNSTVGTQPMTLSARLKQLSREYGYAALAVYLALSALDFPFCFLAVRYFGTERISVVEEQVVSVVKRLSSALQQAIGIQWKWEKTPAEVGLEKNDQETNKSSIELQGSGTGDKEGPSLWTELVLAYAIHKSFIFFRVPLTAAVTPKVVQVLRKWGWNIGKKRVGLGAG